MSSVNIGKRALIQMTARLCAASAFAAPLMGRRAHAARMDRPAGVAGDALLPLHAPDNGKVPVAFLISAGAVVIDFAGPWEVFHQVMDPQTMQGRFQTYTVAETTAPIRVSGGMQIVPDYSLADAPAPKVLVIPAQTGNSPATLDWVREATKHTDVTMSVCTGAFLLAETGLLNGRAATTHHGAYRELEVRYPKVRVERGLRFVDDGNIASSGGLSCGIDLSLHVVARYLGNDTAEQTAYNLEYQGQGWKDARLNAVYRKATVSTPEHPLCPVCDMDVDRRLKSQYRGRTYYFCGEDHKELFDSAPDKFIS
jgi:putative intracellular protease/amidase/YHS domain-containing protein